MVRVMGILLINKIYYYYYFGLKTEIYFSQFMKLGKSKIRAPAFLGSVESPLLGLQTDTFLLCLFFS